MPEPQGWNAQVPAEMQAPGLSTAPDQVLAKGRVSPMRGQFIPDALSIGCMVTRGVVPGGDSHWRYSGGGDQGLSDRAPEGRSFRIAYSGTDCRYKSDLPEKITGRSWASVIKVTNRPCGRGLTLRLLIIIASKTRTYED
jgi:hypothetical protein